MKQNKTTIGVFVAIIFGVILIIAVSNNDTQNTQNNTTENILANPIEKDVSTNTYKSQKVYVKYHDYVDVGASYFEYLNTSGSSLVRGAWYDEDEKYMVISLNGTYYHYCGMPDSAWQNFRSASSFGSHYNAYIKGNYDCRIYPVPEY